MTLAQSYERFTHALDTWQQLWRKALGQLADDDRRWLGVAHNVSDLECLTRRIIEVAVGPRAPASRYLQRVPSFGTREIHEFMRDFVLKE